MALMAPVRGQNRRHHQGGRELVVFVDSSDVGGIIYGMVKVNMQQNENKHTEVPLLLLS